MRHVVFPGPIWFQEEFDLTRQFSTAPKIHHAMVLIAQACNIHPEKRPTLKQFTESLLRLISPATEEPSLNNEELTAAIRLSVLRWQYIKRAPSRRSNNGVLEEGSNAASLNDRLWPVSDHCSG
jgi:hypothetical protein